MAYGNRCGRMLILILAVIFLVHESDARGQGETPLPSPRPDTPQLPQLAETPGLTRMGGRPYPINLPVAMRLGNARGLDIQLASQQLQAASAQLQGARVLWMPSLIFGTDYNSHNGAIQEVNGPVIDSNLSAFMVGGAPYAYFALTDAIFRPLAARQTVRARQALVQAAANDTLMALSQAYFNLQQARGDLAGNRDTLRFAEDLLHRLEKLAPGLAPALEVNRARTQAARLRQLCIQNENDWRIASAELLRVLNLDPNLVVEPIEPPHLRVALLALDKPVEELIPVALTNRPELAAHQAMVQASLRLLQMEKMRPLIPTLSVQGWSTPITGSLAFDYYNANGNLGNFNFRQDYDIQALWTLKNFGLGNRALIRERAAGNRVAQTDFLRVRNTVGAEVVQSYSLAQTAANRIGEAEEELRNAQILVRESLTSLSQTQRLVEGGPIQLLTLPVAVVTALQQLQQAYLDYYGSINDYNRAQFQLYRALGNPAQALLTPDTPQPSSVPTPAQPQQPGR